MIDRRLINNFDWSIFLIMMTLSVISVFTIYSATRPLLDDVQKIYYMKQFYWILLSLFAFIVLISIDYKWYARYAYLIYAVGIILLIAVVIAGKKGMGAQRWLHLGFFSFQPSEFFKIFFILALSRYFSGMRQGESIGFRQLFKMLLIFFIFPAVLILRQPDLGTMLILMFLFISMTLTAGLQKKVVITIVIAGMIAVPLAGNYVWKGLKGYQKHRIIAFIDPQADPQGIGYHITQSKITVGSGGFFGKGYMKGTQGPYRFLPENHTDFIFSIYAEERGFMGSLLLFFLYFFVIWRGFDTAKKARDREGCYMALGVTYMVAFYFLINVGMTLGMVPVVGVPLPLMSYGGTALLSNFIALSIIENVSMRRYAPYY
ncbi:MAG: rod shape-determining protein RodA [Nitrospira sp.]|nr:rod shape-determining protein RodA [bacterium]MBL7049397.1 rod shape-determining protein RodA [Nitrospira sp.]